VGGHYELLQKKEAAGKAEGKVDLSPCHICRRKPTLRHELESYVACESCEERTCWICIRQCEGLGILQNKLNMEYLDVMAVEGKHEGKESTDIGRGVWEKGKILQLQHQEMVCRQCCEERGAEGEVWCLGCLRAVGGD
jgi:hypothetical protein